MKTQPEPVINKCGLCGSTTGRVLYNAKDRLGNSGDSFPIVQCASCGVLQTTPEMTESELARFYPEDYWGGEEPSQHWIEESQSEKTRFLSSCGLSEGTILDVGCGAGFFLRALNPQKWSRFGVETGEVAARNAEAALGNGHVFKGTLIDSNFADSRFDVVTFWSALEHTNDPRANLGKTREIMKDGGSLIVQLPNAGSYQTRLFDGDWFALDAPRHRYHFTLAVLKQLLAETGFEVYRVSKFSRTHNTHALRQSLKTRLLKNGSLAGRAVFYLSIPVLKPVDTMMSALGQGATLTISARAV
jgi:2-polyprenyl-3-methyl-5-hydroxy-6-metoxy-1,4-benzoquinol methylase